MKISVLASGSKGNSSYIETKNTKILVDNSPIVRHNQGIG